MTPSLQTHGARIMCKTVEEARRGDPAASAGEEMGMGGGLEWRRSADMGRGDRWPAASAELRGFSPRMGVAPLVPQGRPPAPKAVAVPKTDMVLQFSGFGSLP
jgi:hypothetical protein